MMPYPQPIIDIEPQIQTQALERRPNMKQIAIIMAASGNAATLAIEPGTTPRDIRRQLNLDENFILTSGRGAEAFGDNENLYPLVPDGAKLYASTPVEVGNQDEFLDDSDSDPSEDSRFMRLMRATGRFPSDKQYTLLPQFEIKVPSFLATNSSRDVPDIVYCPPRAPVPVVQRGKEPYWQERGWQRDGWNYTGYYRSRVGAWKGRAEVGPTNVARLFIHEPPEFLKSHPHWICFQQRPSGWYFIHMTDDVDLSSGILRVEALINEAFRSKSQ